MTTGNKMASALQKAPIIHLMPLLFILFSFIIGIPQVLFHLLLNPHVYIVTTTPFSERVTTLRHKFFYYAWRFLSPMLDPGDEPHKAPLLRKAYGQVLEIGPGVGDNIKCKAHLSSGRLSQNEAGLIDISQTTAAAK